MGDCNSSVTRVWPVFEYLFQRDDTGSQWLWELLRMGSLGSLAGVPDKMELGPLLPTIAACDRPIPGPLRTVLGDARSDMLGRLRSAFEADVPPSEAFLTWLIRHPENLRWPELKPNQLCEFGRSTQAKREALVKGDAEAIANALAELKRSGVMNSRRKWWAFEGFTSVDCLLETENYLLLIEGKRTERISKSTNWFPKRNQVVRNLEVAGALANGKNFGVMVCAEVPVNLEEEVWAESLPHLLDSDRAELKRHYLGCVTWSAIVDRLCDGMALPRDINTAVEMILSVRQRDRSTS